MNTIHIERTIFTNVSDKTRTFGFRMYDNDGNSEYCNSMEEKDMTSSENDFLHKALHYFNLTAQDMFEVAREDNGTIFIDGMEFEFAVDGDDWELQPV